MCTAALPNSILRVTTRIWSGQFRDDGAEVEVRIPIPVDMEGSDGAAVSARHMQVDTQDTTLSIAVQTSQGVQLLFSAPRLYGRVKTSETIWYVDDNEIILSLKKMDTDLKWPALLEGWTSLTTGVSELLKGTSIYVVGASTTINWAVAKELATGLGYVPLQTELLMQELTSRSPSECMYAVLWQHWVVIKALQPKMLAGTVCMLGSQCGYPKAMQQMR
ncbi:hypothetical protein CY35_13G022400 [Sphagnum magellanicum]|nr:hypothetical protein CY35_13G022400 [Sphagnum magellanicum]